MKTRTEDIRDWTEKQCCEFGRLLDNRCLVTGFRINDVSKSISIDRIWDDGRYREEDCMPLWWPCNRSKGKVPFFKTKAAFLAYKTLIGLDGLSNRKAAVFIVRKALENLCIKDQRGNEVKTNCKAIFQSSIKAEYNNVLHLLPYTFFMLSIFHQSL